MRPSSFIASASASLVLLSATTVFGQEISGVRADPPEMAVGIPTDIAIGFRTNAGSKDNLGWSCGINVNFGDGRVEFHRIDSDKLPVKLTHQYASPGNYAVTLEGKLQFKGLNSVLPCTGRNQSVAVIVRAEDYAAREAAERAAKQESLNRAAADRAAAQRAEEQARSDRQSAERAAQKAASDRANAEKQRAAASRASAAAASAAKSAPKPQVENATTEATPKAVVRPPVKARSAMDL